MQGQVGVSSITGKKAIVSRFQDLHSKNQADENALLREIQTSKANHDADKIQMPQAKGLARNLEGRGNQFSVSA